MKLPEYKDYGKMFIDGLLTAVIGFVYLLPVIVLLGILMLTSSFSFGNILSGGTLGVAGALAGLGVYLIVLVIVGAIFGLFATVAILRFADNREFGVAFEFGAVAKKAFTSHYVTSWLITMVIIWVLTLLLNFIPFVGAMIAVYIAGVINMTALGQAYAEAR
jgi:hypothetical protein